MSGRIVAGLYGVQKMATRATSDEEAEIHERRQRQTVAAQAAEPVAPQADLRPGDGPARVLLHDGSDDGGHQYRILGSTTVYSRSTRRLATPISSAYTVNTATVML